MPRERVRLRLVLPPERRRVLARETPMRLLDTQPDVRIMAPSLLLALPPELREMIWDFVLGDTVMQIPSSKPGAYHMLNETRFQVPGINAGRSDDILRAISLIGYPSILRVSKEIRREALPRYYALSVFRFDDVHALVVWSRARSSSAMANTIPSRLLALPAELREMIWDYSLIGTIAQIPRQDEENYAYAFGETQLRLLWEEDRVYSSDEDELQAIKKQGHPAILRTSKQIRHEALPRHYIFSIFRFDDEETFMKWLSARSARVRMSITSVDFMVEDLSMDPAAAGYIARQTETQHDALEAMLTAEGVALRKGVLRTRVNELRE
ncbi:hypothetical protein LTR10_007728 [Elasticomyces elasticus]|nr:hypothetical protein LTR10_007728 [Elasticomyces elasticus]KAK4970729.1 hypothetical protein LTR42_007705 [Elasticomyces elasticus]